MNRGLSSADITALESPSVEFYHIVRFDFSTPLYYTTAPRNITYNGNTYQSSAIITKVPDIKEQLKISPGTISIEWSGASTASLAVPLTNNYRNVNVYIYRYLAATGNAFLIFKGFIDRYSSDDDLDSGTSNVRWDITNHWADWEMVNGRLLTDESQQALFSGDLFLQYAGVTDPVLAWWGSMSQQSTQQFLRMSNGAILPVTPNSLRARLGLPFYLEQNLSNSYDWTSGAASEGVLPVAYGSCSIDGTPVFRDVTGTVNEYLWIVYAIAEGECTSLTDILFDGVSYTAAPYSSNLTATFYSGTDTQAVHGALDTASTEWTTAHQGKGICYVVIRYTYNKDVFQGEPQPQFIISGKKCYDRRTATTAITTNPIIILHDYLTSSRYGKGLSTSEIDYESFNSAADYCDELLTDHDAGLGGTPVTIARHTFNGVITVTDEVKTNVERILSSCFGRLTWVNGKYTVVLERDDDTSVYSFTMDNIKPSIKIQDIGIKDRANKVYYKFIDPSIDYAESTVYQQLSSATITAEDNGKSLQKTITNKFETNRYRAANLAETALKQSRHGTKVEIEASKADAVKIECGKVVDFTLDTRGWDSKLFRVVDMSLKEDGDVNLSLAEYVATDFMWSVQAEAAIPAKTTLTNPLSVTAPTGLTLAATATEQLTKADGTKVNRIKVTWTASADAFAIGYEIQYKLSSDTNYTEIARVTSRTEVEAWIEGITSGVQYDVRIRAYNAIGVTSSWATGNTNGTGVNAIGHESNLVGSDDYLSETFFYHNRFESLDGYSSSGATLNTNGYVTISSTTNANVTKLFTNQKPAFAWANLWRFKSVFRIPSGEGAQLSNTLGLGLLIGVGEYSYSFFGLNLHWVTTSSLIRILARTTNDPSTTTSVIVDIADTGLLIDVTCVLTPGVNMVTTLVVSGTTYTNTITSNLPAQVPFELTTPTVMQARLIGNKALASTDIYDFMVNQS